jgi:hypothetical protein
VTVDSADTTMPDAEPGADLTVTPSPAIVCGTCGRERGISDDYEYNPLQLVTGRPLGWYSNDDGEFCGECLGAMMRGQTP